MTEGEASFGDQRRWSSRSTERAAKILTQFSLDEPRLKVSVLAERLGLHPSTVYRYVEPLEKAGLLEREEQLGTYKLGLKLVELSVVVLRGLAVRQHAISEMDLLRDKLGLLVNLGVLRDAEVVHVAHAFPSGWPREHMDVGRTAVAQSTALGKVLLAGLPWEEACARVTKAGWRPLTSKSIQDEAALKDELDVVRSHGFAVDREESRLGVMCVAVPVESPDRQVSAALSVSGRSEQVAERIQELVGELMPVAKRISARAGASYGLTEYL